MKNLEAKIAAVTGAASGIGRETAVMLAKKGCHVSICDVNMRDLEETAEQIRALGKKAFTIKVDTSNKDEVYDFAQKTVDVFGQVDIIINNAGVALVSTVEKMTYEDFEWLMGINFWGMVYGTKAFLPYLKDRGEAAIVNISSVFGLWGIPSQAAYSCSKFGIRGFSECLAQELLADTKITVTSVHPGGIRTDIVRSARVRDTLMHEDSQETLANGFEKMAHTTPEQAARAIVKGIMKKNAGS